MNDNIESPATKTSSPPFAPWEFALVLVAVMLAFGLGVTNLGGPSLWHDELVHVFVAKNLADTGSAEHLSGTPYYSGTVMNVLLACVIRFWDISERAVRTPSVVLASLNVALAYWLTRQLLGRPTALLAAFALALSPWTVAWSRQARFYTLQQGLYLGFMISFWCATLAERRRVAIGWIVSTVILYALAVLTSFHSILFLGGPGLFACAMAGYRRALRTRWTVAVILIGALGALTLLSYAGLMNPLDREAVFDRGGLGGGLPDAERAVRTYYTFWLRKNLSNGFYALALLGFVAMLFRQGRKGVFVALAFWIPILMLTYLIGYRRPRFMFFVFPFYVAAFSYGAVCLGEFLAAWRRQAASHSVRRAWAYHIGAVCVIVFAARLAWSEVRLVADAFETAGGANTTLARRHPQWRQPCLYVKNASAEAVVVTTTYLPVYYYTGRVDTWYPTGSLWWEADESGVEGLKTLEEFQAYVRENPRGYFISEWWRFERNEFLSAEVAWVRENMTRIEEASSEDVTVYAWGVDP